MIRVLLFFLLLFFLALGFGWVADLPGMISVSWDGYVWEQPPVVAALVVGALLAVFLIAVWIIRVILKSPQIANRFFKRRRQDKGYAALSHGLIALGTGNAKLARRHGLEADRLLSEEPAAKLLLAQTAQLAGKDDEARQRFESMLDDPETKALGLHGLFVEAERHREPVAARHYAEEAAKTSPGLEWAGKAVLGYQAVAHHWDEALKTLERNYAAKLLDKKSYRRERAVILTALAQKLEDGEPERAFSLAKEAHGLALDLVPAAVLTSRLATRRGDIRKAAKVLEATWRLSPNPELAETYAHVRTGDSAVDRLKRVKSLSAQRTNTPEGAMAIARAAIEAREFEEARTQLKKVLQSEPTRSAFLLMAEVEEAEHGDKGRMRDWLARALKAPQDKAWVADGIVSAEWQPVSPVTGKLDAFQWTNPGTAVDEDGDLVEDSLFEAPALPVAAPAEPMAVVEPAEQGPIEETKSVAEAKTVELEAEPLKKEAAPVETAVAETKPAKAPSVAVNNGKQGYEGTTDDVHHSPALNDLPDASAKPASSEPDKEDPTPAAKAAEEPDASEDTQQTKPVSATGVDNGTGDEPAGDKEDAKSSSEMTEDDAQSEEKKADEEKADGEDDKNRPIQFPLSRMPDDPGTEDDDKDSKAKPSRPRFFN
ncbi:heme biosynthesis HemY N-terminal domain-containing protein [Labrenzia sp. DG1229]|uniref:heme biosynthesis HemY N-terminal domain-containing protein n=1 Tax=Labrenzia sp. DG1229 TaxID=681847 RepID=UPI0004907179|nr:heme biosynthesis HemY N-terminal domain-containing protein [Labrenzia sp. DG1229]